MPPARKKAKTGRGHATKNRSQAANSSSAAEFENESALTKTTFKGRGGGRVRQGALKSLPDMPLDILVEIFTLLHPRDLLNITRTTKAFRDLLMSRTTEPFWKASRKNVQNLPDIPAFMSEPAFASLLFSNHCHACAKKGEFPLICNFFVRYCGSCKKEMLIRKYYDDAVLPRELRDARLFASIPGSRRWASASDRIYHKPELDELKNEWLQQQSAAAKQTFLTERKQRVAQRGQHAIAIAEWVGELEAAKTDRRENTKWDRFEAIQERLRGEGWADELDLMSEHDMDKLFDLKEVNVATKLTDRGWNNIRENISEFMEGIRSSRIKCEYHAKMSKRFQCLLDVLKDYRRARWAPGASVQVIGSVGDYYEHPDVRAILEDDSETATLESITARLSELLPKLIEDWARRYTEEFATIVRNALGETAAARTETHLKLAVAAFHHSSISDSSPIRWPAVANPEYLRVGICDSQEPYQHEACVFINACEEYAHPLGQYLVKKVKIEPFYQLIREIITACDFDPDIAMPEALDNCEVRLRCRLCAQIVKQEVFDWWSAIHHDIKHHCWGDKRPSPGETKHWDRLAEEDAANARALEKPLREKFNSDCLQRNDYWYRVLTVCTWCGKNIQGRMQDVRAHLERRHGKQHPQVDVDFYFPEGRLQEIWMYSDMLRENKSAVSSVKAGKGFFASVVA